ncbi:TFIIB-type zinc finger domain-containing protein [Epibacterium ulvae]|uniref:TFIIB-type zinc finger domain-containing protein n=1 Tax=Epibacterium ulvae TaxID=1156985 RepID=UPI001BFCC17F|nr:TFIIB-type zinc finger domain-containing protein [Epibacterium ulvae]MBT8154489.1 TFIIB-type zinc finger domain-containing protein [Epibacterium ulvae]
MSQMPPPPPSPQQAEETHRFHCEQCGADYRYHPENGTLTCDHCGHTDQIHVPTQSAGPWGKETSVNSAMEELDFKAALNDALPEAEMEVTRVTACPNCAAQVEFDPTTHAQECPFCATPVVADTGPNRHIKPKGVVPFIVDERKAQKAMTDWLGRLWFAPNGLQEYARKGRKMDGIYVPFWTYDAQTRTQYRGQRGTVYYVEQRVVVDGKSETRRVTKVRWRGVSGRVQRFFDDVLILASKSLPKRNTEGLEPWDLSQLEPYQPQYLAGFRAEAYAVDIESGFAEARAKMDRVIERDVRFDIGGDRQRIDSLRTEVSDVTFKHVLLPVWLAAYKYRGKTYRFVVNGQSGRVQGERPYSAWKIAIAVVLGLVVLGGFALVAGTK